MQLVPWYARIRINEQKFPTPDKYIRKSTKLLHSQLLLLAYIIYITLYIYNIEHADLRTTALEVFSEVSLMKKLKEVWSLKRGGAHSQHVRGHGATDLLHPQDVANCTNKSIRLALQCSKKKPSKLWRRCYTVEPHHEGCVVNITHYKLKLVI